MIIRILTITVILCILFGSGCTSEKPEHDAGIASEKPKHDAGIAAYERAHYQTALYDFELRAVKDDPVAQFCLGFMCKHGEGVIANEDTAGEWYTKAAEQGYVPAQINLVAMYVHRAEDEVRKISDTLEELERVEALESSVEKLTSLRNIRVEELASAFERLHSSYRAATQWTMEAADSPSAPYNLALFSISLAAMFTKVSELSPQELKNSKMPIPELYDTAVLLFKAAAAKDYAPAQNELAKIYRDGLWGITPDPKKALELFETAATPNSDAAAPYKKGYAPAQFNLAEMYKAKMYKDPTSQPKDSKEMEKYAGETLRWYQMAAEQGHAPAQYQLGLIYDFASAVKFRFDPDGREVNESLKKALEKTPTGTEKSKEDVKWDTERSVEAINWYIKAADQDYAPAQSSLFFVYSASDQYSEKALRLVFKAAQQGEAWGQFILAVKFQNGEGVPQDDKEAYYWYRLALENKGGLANPARPKAQQDKSLAAIFKWSGEVERKLSEDQREEIQKRVANWKPRILVGSGTGFYIDKNHILTNAHVARLYLPNSDTSHRYDEVRVRYRYVEEKPGSVDWQVDLALLYDDSPPPRGNTAAAIFRRTPVDFGEPIAVFGYPLSLNQLSYRGNGTSGIVSGLAGATIYLYPKNFFQFTAPVQSGNSGGPVFDRAGHVVGVVVSQLSSFLELKDGKIKIVDGRGEVVDRQNINFAIKFDVVEKFLNDKNGITPASEGSDTTKDLDSTQIFKKARKFTVPVLCFLNKGEDPLPVVEMSINDINN